MTEEKCNVDEHEEIADCYGKDVRGAFSIDFVFHRSLYIKLIRV